MLSVSVCLCDESESFACVFGTHVDGAAAAKNLLWLSLGGCEEACKFAASVMQDLRNWTLVRHQQHFEGSVLLQSKAKIVKIGFEGYYLLIANFNLFCSLNLVGVL